MRHTVVTLFVSVVLVSGVVTATEDARTKETKRVTTVCRIGCLSSHDSTSNCTAPPTCKLKMSKLRINETVQIKASTKKQTLLQPTVLTLTVSEFQKNTANSDLRLCLADRNRGKPMVELMGAQLVLPKTRPEFDPSLWATSPQNFTTRVCTFLRSLPTLISRGGSLDVALTPTFMQVSKKTIHP